jgi:PAS domain-containing protein
VLPELVEQGFVTLLDQVYGTGEPYVGKEIQVRLRRRDNGAERTVLLDFVYQPIRGRSGAVAGIFVQGVDVTEHTANSERLRIAQEAGGIGSFEWFPDTDAMVCSDTYRRLWGLPDDVPITGSMLVDMVDPDNRNEVGPVKFGLQENPLEYAEYQITRADNGEKRWLARRGKVVERNGEKRYLGVAFDITHRKQIDQALRDSETRIQQSNEFIRLLLDSTEEGFYSIDSNGVTTLCNRAFMRMLGFSHAAQVIGHRLHDLIHHSRPDGSFYHPDDCPILRTARNGSTAAASRWNTGPIRCAATACWKARCAPSPISAPGASTWPRCASSTRRWSSAWWKKSGGAPTLKMRCARRRRWKPSAS